MRKTTITLLASAALAMPAMVPALAQHNPQNQQPQMQQNSAAQQQPNRQQASQTQPHQFVAEKLNELFPDAP